MKVKVLVVDDQKPFQLVASAVVDATEDFEVVGVAARGEEAVELAQALSPDLVLMDVNLPGMDGIEATRRILARTPGVVVLLLSTYEAAEYAPRAGECGAVRYVPKSEFGPETLLEARTAAPSR
jgi:two-component system, NarL family, invasion response regulator UvrY